MILLVHVKFKACEAGDNESLVNILNNAQEYYNLDINCKDSNGKSALVIALENERLECLETLLDFGVKVGDALLYAIKKQQVSAVKILFRFSNTKLYSYITLRIHLNTTISSNIVGTNNEQLS